MSRYLDTFHRWLAVWWRLFVSAAAVALIATLSWVTYTVVDERTYFEQEQARDRRQDRQLERLIQAQREDDRREDEQIAAALAEAGALLDRLFAQHDHNIASKLNDLLAQIAALHDRPAGTRSQPVAAISLEPVRLPAPSPGVAAPSPQPRPAPTTTTTTTTPDQRRCAADPAHPRC